MKRLNVIMKNINVKRLILTIFAIFYFAVTNICIFYGYQYEPEYTYVSSGLKIFGVVLIFAIFSPIFYFIIIHLYGDKEKFKLKSFVISVAACILNVVYAINSYHLDKKFGTFSNEWGDTTSILFFIIAYLFVWQKLNWLNKMKYKLLNLTSYKKSRKRKNNVKFVLNFLTENPLFVMFVLLQGLAVSSLIGNRYTFKQWIENDEKAVLLIILAMAIMSLMQLTILIGLTALYKNRKIYSIIIASVASMFIMPIALNYDFFDYHIDIFYIKDKMASAIESKKVAKQHRKDLEKELENGSKKFLENFEIANDIHVAKVGQVIKFGKTFVKNNMSGKEDAYYYVLKKENEILTLISLFCIDYVDNDFMYKNGNKGYYDYLDNAYYINAFTDAEKKIIVDTIAKDQSKHKVYLPNTNDLLLLSNMENKANLGVVNDTLLKEIRKHKTIFNDFYFRGACEYLIEPHILKPNTIRTRIIYNGVNDDAVYDYDEKRNLDYHGEMTIFIRTKISIRIDN